jgi:hypothetical protein
MLTPFIFFYIITFIYVREPHYKYIGYIMLAIVYILSCIAIIMNRELYIENLTTLTTSYTKWIILVIAIVVSVSLSSIITIIDAYTVSASSKKSFDLKLNTYYKNQLATFENTFIIGNVLLALIFVYLTMDTTHNKVVLYIGLLVPFVCVWFQLASAIRFSKIKKD